MRGASPGGRTRGALLTIGGLALGFGVPALDIGSRLFPGPRLTALMAREGVWWMLVIAMLLWVRVIERQPIASIGWRRPDWKSAVFAIPVGAAMVAIILVSYSVVFPALGLHPNVGRMSQLMATPLWFRFLLVLRAAVAEEIIYRAYPIERIAEVTGSRALALAVSVVAFAQAHISSWGLAQLIPVTAGGLLLGGYYLWRRDLPSNMIAHFIADGSGFLLG